MKSTTAAALLSLFVLLPQPHVSAEVRAGAAVVDVTPVQFPVLLNGGFLSRSEDRVKTPVNARAIVLDDGRERIGIVVVDSCMMPRTLLDEAKQLAAARTEIQPDRMLISATHTHTAPSCLACLGTDADPTYVPFLREKLAQALAEAEANLEPAQVGWAVRNAASYTALRRWIRRPDRVEEDPFGNRTVRANMHAGANWDNVTGESGPEDPDLSLISFQATEGRPIAVLANFSMHYFGDQNISADYFGLFCDAMRERLRSQRDSENDEDKPPFVGIMSHGCSGDIWRRDYMLPAESRDKNWTIASFADGLLDIAMDAYGEIQYTDDADLAMSEKRMELKYRVPDTQLLEWAQRIVTAMGDQPPKTRTEVYAREQIILDQRQSTEIVVQALRIGDVAIATTPTETYALTGLKLKLQSPLPKTMVIELANGGDGYIPPPEQHLLGGYNTWPARSAGLEVSAEPRIAEAALGLLEEVAGRDRIEYQQSCGPAVQAIQKAGPVAYWRMDEFAGPRAVDASGRNCDAFYEPGVAFFLEGPRSNRFCTGGERNRAAHFAGGRLASRIAGLGECYSVSLWFWNGMPVEGRGTTGWMFSRGRNNGLGPHGDHLGLGGTETQPGKLIFQHGPGKAVVGKTPVDRWTWNQVAMVRDQQRVLVYLNGATEPEIETTVETDFPEGFDRLFLGGRCDNQANWEGRLDEIAVFDRVLSADEIQAITGR